MGGQGKSEICLQLAHRVRQDFWGVFWVDVSTASSAKNDFLNIASKLGISAQSSEEARQGLANVKQPWLLVLDNADDPKMDYQDYFPPGPSGVVILTSRNAECHRYASTRPVELEGLPESDALELLLRAANVPLEQQDDAQGVTGLLRSHPLALIQAGAYISRGHCTLAEYPQVYKRQRKRLLKFRPTQAQSRYRDVYATFEASADVLQAMQTEVATDALQLLPVLGTCAASRLPLPLFEAAWKRAQIIDSSNTTDDDDSLNLSLWHVAHLPPFLQADADAWDSFRLVEAVSLLKAFSFVSTDTHDEFLSVSMHPLTNAWARDRLDKMAQHDACLATGCLMAISGGDETLWRKQGRQLQPHLESLMSWDLDGIFALEPTRKITCIITKCGWLLYQMRDDAKLSVLMSNLMTYLILDPLIVDAKWLPVYDLTARNLVDFGRSPEAVPLLEQVVQIREQTLPKNHSDRLVSQHELARAYLVNRQVKEAVSLLEQVVQIREQILAEDHPERLVSQHELARAYKANGQVKEAVSLLEQVVQITEQTLAEDYPDRLISQHELASAYLANSQVKEAVSLLEHVVQIQEQTLAEDHPNRLASQHELARAYHANRQLKEAVSLLEHVVEIKGKILAEDHPSRLVSQHELARAYDAYGQVQEAVALLEQVVKIKEQTLAEDHPERLVSRHNLATYLWDFGRRDAALQMMKHVVEVRRKVLDKHHPHRMLSEDRLKIFEDEMIDIESE
ncbi:MAG: hypothetical protein LQ338_003383 [Usnochroma carphineum]|nr:MAG: hypothetical protein LQ338_003383 [Usnochroma carphineum]